MGSKLGRKIFGKFAEINLQTSTKQNEVELSPLHFANVQILIQNKYAYTDTKNALEIYCHLVIKKKKNLNI